jgi:tetratricopeptide (TPR) repeat protein
MTATFSTTCRISRLALAGCIIAFLGSCLAPARPPEKPPVEEETVPYSSVAAFLAVGDPQAALDEYDASMKEEPKSRETRTLHARLLMMAGKLEEARDEFNLLLAEDDRDTMVLYNLSILEGLDGNRKAQKEFLEKTIAADPAHADALSSLGDLFLEEKELAKAKQYFDNALKSDEGNFLALLGEGAILLQNKEYSRASEVYTRAIEKEPEYPFSYIDRARSKKALGDSTGAIQDLSEAIALDPQYSWSYLDRGKLYFESGKTDQALEDLTIAIELDPSTFSAFALRGHIYYLRQENEKALADFNALVALKPSYYFAYEPLGILKYMRSDWEGTYAAFSEAYRYQKDEFAYALLAGLALRRQGNTKEAVKYLQGVLPKIPREVWPYDVCRFLIDPVADDLALVMRIEREKNKSFRARMIFYLAVQYLMDGKIRAAQSYLLDIDGSGGPETAETQLARWELGAMEVKE